MAKTRKIYDLDHEWRKGPQEAFWEALKFMSPDTFSELDAIAKAWAEVAPGRDIPGKKFASGSASDYTESILANRPPGGLNYTPDNFLGWRLCGERDFLRPGGWTYVPGGGRLPAGITARREAWQRSHNLATPWLSEKADRHILTAYTGISVSKGYFHMPNGNLPPPRLLPGLAQDRTARAAYLANDYNDNVLEPWLGRSRVQTIEAAYHLEWVVLYQCGRHGARMSFPDIAKEYSQKDGHYGLEPRTVESGAKSAADIIQLPLRPYPRGRKSKS